MRKCLRKVSQSFTAPACLLRKQTLVIGEAKHLLEHQPCLIEPRTVLSFLIKPLHDQIARTWRET